MAQSVELVVDPAADRAVRRQWDLLGDAGLPTARRVPPADHHRPHVTLYASTTISADTDARLAAHFGERDRLVGLGGLRIGALMLFGPRHGSYVLVRQVLASAGLLDLQRAVAAICAAEPGGPFGAGRWAPHITLARRLRTDQIGPALAALAGSPEHIDGEAVRCRRWDGQARNAWWLA